MWCSVATRVATVYDMFSPARTSFRARCGAACCGPRPLVAPRHLAAAVHPSHLRFFSVEATIIQTVHNIPSHAIWLNSTGILP